MKNSLLNLIALLLPLVFLTGQEKQQPPKGGTPKNFSLPEKETIAFDNGLELVLIPYGSIPKANIQVSVKTGNIHEGPDQIWLSDLMADLMEEGSTSRNARQIADEMAGMGGNLNIGVGAHHTTLSASVLYEFAPDAIEVLADVLRQPSWPEGELDRLKGDMKRNLAVQLSRPRSQAYRDFMASIYPDHAYGRVFPTEEMIDSYTVADIRAFYEAQVGARRTTVYVAGNFDAEAVREAVRNALADWREGPEEFYPVAEAAPAEVVKIIDRPGAPQSTIYYGLPVPDPSQEDFLALDVTNSILGGSFASRITSNIREDKGYTYSPTSIYDTNYKTALWYERADVTTEHTGASIAEIKKEISRLQEEPPTPEELEGIINYESGIFVLQNSSPSGIIGQLVFLDTHELDESFLENKVANMHAVTPEKIMELTRKYIRLENMTLIVVGDKAKVESQLQETVELPLKQ
ncbi:MULTISPECIES: M16 family metallopeptidase [unclassified Robiginitalea]|uniref:M16 family metallopeptidase n=1 Tax=Robiginitalea TaxID=252306 RepID=UPI002348FBB9|nr:MULTISPECIES: pitrilysin family protein [unclassified Robiginitalea]MDC6354201.1 pitrilysin family protein [Robiginitalea sp. PM2]MDC6374468.1 pitrilysin family protein [Robiginitalea sp. SP8]